MHTEQGRGGQYSLDSSSDRAEDDGKVHRPWLAPLVSDLPADRVSLVVGQALDSLEVGRILCYESALSQQRQSIFDPVLGRKLVHVTEKLSLGDAGQRVLHSVFPQLRQYGPSLNSAFFQLGGVRILYAWNLRTLRICCAGGRCDLSLHAPRPQYRSFHCSASVQHELSEFEARPAVSLAVVQLSPASRLAAVCRWQARCHARVRPL